MAGEEKRALLSQGWLHLKILEELWKLEIYLLPDSPPPLNQVQVGARQRATVAAPGPQNTFPSAVSRGSSSSVCGSARLVCGDGGGGTSLGMLPPVKRAFRAATQQESLCAGFPSLSLPPPDFPLWKAAFLRARMASFHPKNQHRATPTS